MAAAATCYKRFLTLLEKWPIDRTKTGRDIGEYLKETIDIAYKGNKFETNLAHWDKQYLSLQRILNNEYKNKYPRTLTSSATGLTREQCNIALSNDFLEELQSEEKSFWRRFFSLKPNSQ